LFVVIFHWFVGAEGRHINDRDFHLLVRTVSEKARNLNITSAVGGQLPLQKAIDPISLFCNGSAKSGTNGN
jgi:hypothetical protein